MNQTITILGISGSLRADAANSQLIKAIASMATGPVRFSIYEGLGNIPPFNDSNAAPEPVLDFRKKIREADGVFICTPEYAFGVPGVLKNALDWTVGSGEFDQKPVAFISAATGGENAYASLMLTLRALSTNLSKEATLLLPFIRTKLNTAGEIIDPATSNAVRSVLEVLVGTIKSSKE